MLPEILYRALRPAEIEAGCVLIPKAQKPFVAHPRLHQVLPFDLGLRVEHAVREHQWEGQFETSGVSTTPHLSRARHYAKHKTIVEIDTSRFAACGITFHRVSDHVDGRLICVPEDDEIILTHQGDTWFPKSVIKAVLRL